MNAVIPYDHLDAGKKKQVAQMFDNIAFRYDFLNHFLSMGIDKIWRRKAVKIISEKKPAYILDIATGTGDFAIQISKIKPIKITGIDISKEMLNVGIKKVEKKGLNNSIELLYGDSENIEFSDFSFDIVTAAFGVRNFENLFLGLKEMNRVLKPGGRAVILELSQPPKFPYKQIYNFYFTKILPFIGKMFSKDDNAYTYLPKSVYAFPSGNDFLKELTLAGFKNVRFVSLTFGVASIYIGEK